MRKSLQEFRDLMLKENKLSLLQRTNYEKSNGLVEAAIREEMRFFREAIHTVIKKTVLDLIHIGKKDWQKFYDRVQ